MEKTTLVIGASEKVVRYSNICVRSLQDHNIPTFAIGSRLGAINHTSILTGFPQMPEIHTVTLYINPEVQKEYYNYIFQLQPKRVIFNPGTTNPDFSASLREKGIEVINDCTIIMLRNKEF
jgi:predicted CoA-binding protein